MSSTLVKIGTGLSFLNTAWLVGLSGWLWSFIPNLTKSVEEMEEVIIEMEEEVATVEKMRKEIEGFQLSLDDVEQRLSEFEKQCQTAQAETKQSFLLIFQELNQMGIEIKPNDNTRSDNNFWGTPRQETRHIMENQNMSSRRGARGGRGGRGRGARGGSHSTRDKIDDDIEFLASLED